MALRCQAVFLGLICCSIYLLKFKIVLGEPLRRGGFFVHFCCMISIDPCPALRPYVSRFAVSPGGGTYTVLPDTELVMGFQYQGRLKDLATAGITGLLDTARNFTATADTRSILVYFKPGRAAPFFEQPMHELHGLSLGVAELWPAALVRSFEDRLASADNDVVRIQLLEAFLLERLRRRALDPMVSEALSLLTTARGQIRVSALAESLHTSTSPLEKRFRREVGATPKQFASLLRFREILKHRQPDLTKAAYEAGYFDQAHFIRDFKAFTGETPGKYFKNG